jgi:hypothetical protein
VAIKKIIPFIYQYPTIVTVLLMACLMTGTGLSVQGQAASANVALDSATTFAYYPSLHKLEVRIADLPSEALSGRHEATAVIRRQGNKKVVAKQTFNVTGKNGSCMMNLPKLENGTYELTVTAGSSGLSVVRSFRHKNFPWLGNNLGKSNVVYAPFEPVRIKGKDVQVVLRTYTMNGFGLWDNVKSDGKEILAGPVVLHLVTEKGELKWNFSNGKWISQAAKAAVYQAEAVAAPVRVKSTSTIEYDGCMRVEMELSPGTSKEVIQHLWLEIPIKNNEAPLFHYVTVPDIRRNYAGATPHGGKITWMSQPLDTDPPKWPQGAQPPLWKAEPASEDGVLWTCRDIRPWEHVFKTDFVPYIWLGGATRGISWFGDSPSGYMLDSKGTMQHIERVGSTLSLNVDLINKPGILTTSRKIVFGLEASPTRPMPKGWRSNVAIPALPAGEMVCWGGHACASKYPDDDDFHVVNELIKVRQTGIFDSAVFVKLDQERSHHFKVLGTHTANATWLTWVLYAAKMNQAFALEGGKASNGVIQGAALAPYRYHVDGGMSPGPPERQTNPVWKTVSKEELYPERVANKIRNAPLPIYFEEHASIVSDEEWAVYQDEWRGRRVQKTRSEFTDATKVVNNFKVGRQGAPRSYRDFSLWYANEWMKRGVSIYIDNIFLNVLDNPLTSSAFIDDEGDLQPAAGIWDLREYHKRIWVLEQEWNLKHPPYPIMITHHMTNTVMLPVHTWNDAMLDLEWWTPGKYISGSGVEPFSAEFLLAEGAGRQTGSYRHLLTSVESIEGRRWFTSLDPNIVRTEWGMRMVHEVLRWLFPYENYAAFEPARSLEKKLWQFGYGTEDCKVINYWSDNVPIKVSDPQVKWLLLERKSDKTLLLVLQSYEKEGAAVNVKLDAGGLGFLPFPKAHEVEMDAEVKINSSGKELTMKVSLPGRFGTKVLIIGSGS